MLSPQQRHLESSRKPCTDLVRTAYRSSTHAHSKQAIFLQFLALCVLNLYRYSTSPCTDLVHLIRYTRGMTFLEACS